MSGRGHSLGEFELGCRAWARFGEEGAISDGDRVISGILGKFGHIGTIFGGERVISGILDKFGHI